MVAASLWGPQFFPHLSAAPVEDRPTQDGKPHTAAPQLRPPKGCIPLLHGQQLAMASASCI